MRARILYSELGYIEFRNFDNLIYRCAQLIDNGVENGIITPCTTQIKIGSGAVRVIKDYELDEQAEFLVRRMAIGFKTSGTYPIRNETVMLGLLKKFCVLNNIDHDFQFNLNGFVYDFRYENVLVEFDENHHRTKRQKNIDGSKDKEAIDNGYEIIRFNFCHDIIDIIQALNMEKE